MYDFIETETGWIVFWGPVPELEEQKETALEDVKRVAFVQEERAAPVGFWLSLTK